MVPSNVGYLQAVFNVAAGARTRLRPSWCVRRTSVINCQAGASSVRRCPICPVSVLPKISASGADAVLNYKTEKVAERALARVAAHFTWPVIARQHIDFFEELLAGRK